jgi:ABC-2 type transport system permease protein
MKKVKVENKPSQFRAFKALTKASILSSLRSTTALFFNFIFPFIFISIFGIIGGGGERVFDIALREESLKEGPVYEAINQTEILNLKEDMSEEEIDESLNKGNLAIAITITEQKESPGYNLIIEKSAAAPQDVQIISQILNGITESINFNPEQQAQKLVKIEEKLIEGRKFEQIDFILPGQLAFALLTNALFGISFTFLTLKKDLVLKRFFASPIKKSTVLFSESIGRIIIGILQTLLIVLVGHYLFDFTLANGITTLFEMLGIALVGITVFIGFGFLVASLAKNEEAVSPLANLIMMPQLFLSGAFFPIEAFPEFLQPIAKVMPMTYLNEAFKKVAFEGVSIVNVWPQLAALAVWGVIVYAIVIKTFKWEI